MTVPGRAPTERNRGFRFIWTELTPGRRGRLLVVLVASFLGGLVDAASLLVLARIAFALVNDNKPVDATFGPLVSFEASVGALIGLAAALVVTRFLIQAVTVRTQASLSGEVLEDVRTQMLHGYLRASWSLQSNERDGRLQELASSFASRVSAQMTALSNLLVASLTLTAMLGVALFANALATLVMGTAALTFVALLRPFRTAVRRRSKTSAQASIELSTAVNEVASLSQEVHVFGVGPRVERHLDALTRRTRVASERLQVLNGMVPAFHQAAALLMVIGGVGFLYALGGTRLASLGAVILIGLRSISYSQTLQSSILSLHSGVPYVDTVLDERARFQEAEVATGTRALARIDHLEFEDVAYSYDGRRFALTGVSFAADRGHVIGIVGPSGAGKSTLVQLLLRLREPDAGRILVDGVDAHEFRVDDWAAHVVFVAQEAHILSGTVADNIRFFRDIPPEAVERAGRLAHLHDEIVQWPDGYETAVGERGRKLSGGQRQRLTIARALVGEPAIVVLDEPTSNLDVHSEAAIRATMVELSEHAMVFVIAHRLSTLDICDRIMVIQDGELRGFGEPKRLEESSEFYREALRLSGLR